MPFTEASRYDPPDHDHNNSFQGEKGDSYMPEFRFPKWGIWAASVAAAIAVTTGATTYGGAEKSGLDTEPEGIAHAVEAVAFEDVGQMAVSSKAVVRATVTAVNPGRIVGADETAEPGEETAATQARDVTLNVTQAWSRNNFIKFPEPIVVEEWGWDADGDGYQVNNYTWSEVGKEYLFFLKPTSDPKRWNVINTEGRADIDQYEWLSSSAEEGSALAQSIESYEVFELGMYLTRIYDTKNPPEDMPTPADMPEPAPSGYGNEPITNPTAEPPVDLGTADGSEPTPYPSPS